MSRKQSIIISITGINIVLLILLGLTYGCYLTCIQGNSNDTSISVSTASLQLVYSAGNGTISDPDKLKILVNE